MTEISMNLSDITDSREVMESKPFPMVIYFIYLLLGIILISLTWMYFSELDIVAKGSGIVRPEESVSIVNNKVTGRVASTDLKEGLSVQKGDVLYVIMHDDLLATKDLLNVELSKKSDLLANWQLYKESVLKRENLFDMTSEEQRDFYFKYVGFSEDLTAKTEAIRSNEGALASLKNQYDGMLRLKGSIDGGYSLFANEKELYALKYSEYRLKRNDLQKMYEDSLLNYENISVLYENGAASKNEYIKAQSLYLQNQIAFEQYGASYGASLESEIESTRIQIQRLESELKSLTPNGYGDEASYLPIETKAIIEIDNKISSIEQEIRGLNENLTKIELDIDKCIVKAETAGNINVNKSIAVGDYIGAGERIATVIPQENLQYTIQIMMPEREISSIDVGDTVKFHFHALPYREYGKLNGTVRKISSDASINEATGISYFLVEADVENAPLYSYKGERADLKVGMTCEAQVITKSKKVLFFLLEKIDLWD